jgi:hypothetical protein
MLEPVIRRVRPLAVGLGVGALAGLVIGGAGSRLAMRLVALADEREDFGRETSAGAVVGDVTAGGTLVVFVTGLALGVFGGVLYLALRHWLPGDQRLRTLAFAWSVTGVGVFQTVNGNQEDFVFLDLGRSLGLFGLTFLLFGLAVPPLVDRLAPAPRARPRGGVLVTTIVVALALVAAVFGVKHAVELSNGTRIPG